MTQHSECHIVYCTKDFPSPTETFIQQEIQTLLLSGARVTVLALDKQPGSCRPMPEVVYAPPVYSLKRLFAWIALRPSLSKTLRVYRDILDDVPVGKSLRWIKAAKHLSTAIFFARVVDALPGRSEIALHGAFANLPATIVHAMAQLLALPFSFSAHACDLYVQAPATLKRKVQAAQWVSTCTYANREYLQKLTGNAAHVHLLYHGVDTRVWCPGAGSAQPTGKILAVARLVEKKGLKYLLEAFGMLLKSRGDLTLTIVGSGPLEADLKNMVQHLNIGHAVEWKGTLDKKSVLEIYRLADVLVVPSVIAPNGDIDGMPNVVLEALACEVPVVASDLPGIREAVVPGKTGLLVAPGDSVALAQTLTSLLDDRSLHAQLKQAGRRYVVEQFDLGKTRVPLLHLFGLHDLERAGEKA